MGPPPAVQVHDGSAWGRVYKNFRRLQRQPREQVAERALARGQPGFRDLADDLGGARHQLRAARWLDRAARALALRLEALARRRLVRAHARTRRLAASARLAGRGPLGPGRALASAVAAPAFSVVEAASALLAVPVAPAAPVRPLREEARLRGSPLPLRCFVALRAAIRRSVARCGRVRGRFESTPCSTASALGRPLLSSGVGTADMIA